MNKKQIGEALKSELAKGYDIVKISRWAFSIYSENLRSLTPSLCEILENLFVMEDDQQFELTQGQIEEIANKLILEGEKEDLQHPDSKIKEQAKELEGSWLMCPLCQEAWEDKSTYSMLRCPNCKSKLHNPKFGLND